MSCHLYDSNPVTPAHPNTNFFEEEEGLAKPWIHATTRKYNQMQASRQHKPCQAHEKSFNSALLFSILTHQFFRQECIRHTIRGYDSVKSWGFLLPPATCQWLSWMNLLRGRCEFWKFSVFSAFHQIILLWFPAEEHILLNCARWFPQLSAQLSYFLGGGGRFLMVLHLGMCRSATLGAKWRLQ